MYRQFTESGRSTNLYQKAGLRAMTKSNERMNRMQFCAHTLQRLKSDEARVFLLRFTTHDDTETVRLNKIAGMIMAKNARGVNALTCAASTGVPDTVFGVLDAMTKFLPISQVQARPLFAQRNRCRSSLHDAVVATFKKPFARKRLASAGALRCLVEAAAVVYTVVTAIVVSCLII